MKLEQTHIAKICAAFERMQSKEDLLQLLNEVKPQIYGIKTVPFELKQLTWNANPNLAKNRYVEFKIKKKSKGERSIHAPIKGLKAIQKALSIILQCVFEPHYATYGFVREKSIVDNAKIHAGQLYVYNIDLKDFFHSIDQARFWKCLQLHPFNLVDKNNIIVKSKTNSIPTNLDYDLMESSNLFVTDNLNEFISKFNFKIGGKSRRKSKGSRLGLASLIANLCFTEMEVERKNKCDLWQKEKRNVLPQGAPTSPVITNIVCQRLDYLLSGVAKRFGLKYSRYADDITFSSMHNVYQHDSEFIKELHRIIAEQNFYIKESKTRLQKDGHRKEVTGLLVNEKANVQKRFIKQLRKWLYYWERYGYDRASGFFLQQYIADKGHVMNGKPEMTNVIAGKLDYLKMVKGNENELYTKLKERFDKISGLQNSMDQILAIWENDGIEKAMNIFYKNMQADVKK